MQPLTRPPEHGRGCGYRDEEMPYLCTGLARKGMPMEHFLLDPVRTYDDVWQRGYTLIEIEGVVHVLIFVSKETYPGPWDFFAEAKDYGVSRKMSRDFPFHALTPEKSKMFFAHERAIPRFEYRMKAPVYSEGQAEYMTRLHGCKWTPSRELCKAEKLPYEQPSKFWPHMETPTGYHPPDARKPCTMALKELSWFIHSQQEALNYTLTEIGDRFSVLGPSFSYAGAIPALLSGEQVAWATGVFMATYISHVEFANKADKKSADQALSAGYDVKTVPW